MIYRQLTKIIPLHPMTCFCKLKKKINIFFFFTSLVFFYRLIDKSIINKATFYMEEIQNDCRNAIIYGRNEKSEDWINSVYIKSLLAIDSFYDKTISNVNDEEKKIDLLLKIRKKSNEHVVCLINYQLSTICYKGSLKLRDSYLNNSCRYINECNYYYEECIKLRNQLKCSKSLIEYFRLDESDLNELANNKLIQECILEAQKHKQVADQLLDKLLNYEECLDFEQVWNCIDLYRESIVKTRDKDIELEAEVLSKLGLVYSRILKMNDRAKTCYYACFNLAESMKPKVFTHHSWYIRCCSAIKEYQKEVIDQENQKEETERKKVEKEIEDDLKELKKQADKEDRISFINFVYEKYPPKLDEKKFKKPNLKTESPIDEIKKVYKKALIHFHPDKNSGAKYGYAWHFIAVEIAKYLGHFYERLK